MEEADQTAIDELGYTDLSVGSDIKLSIQFKNAFVRSQLLVAKCLLLHIASSIQHNVK